MELRDALSNAIQKRLDDEVRIRPDFYEPSPGQIPSHVSHRVTQVVMDALTSEYNLVVAFIVGEAINE